MGLTASGSALLRRGKEIAPSTWLRPGEGAEVGICFYHRSRIWFDFCNAAMQHCSMAIAVPISKRGTFTIPPEIRKRLGVDQLENPMLLVEERDGKLYLEPAAAVPVRDIPKATLRGWIRQDEADMAAFKKTRKRRL